MANKLGIPEPTKSDYALVPRAQWRRVRAEAENVAHNDELPYGVGRKLRDALKSFTFAYSDMLDKIGSEPVTVEVPKAALNVLLIAIDAIADATSDKSAELRLDAARREFDVACGRVVGGR